MADSSRSVFQAPLLPAEYPRTATQLLLAQGGDPFAFTRAQVWSAWHTVRELIDTLPEDQQGLHERFSYLSELLGRAFEASKGWQMYHGQLEMIRRNPPPAWGEEHVGDGAAISSKPVPSNAADDPVFGFSPAIAQVRTMLEAALAAAAQHQYRPVATYSLYVAGRTTHAAAAARHLAMAFTAAVWDFERPAMPPMPSGSGRIELRPSPRPAPQTRWSRNARAMFLQNRVEFTTDAGPQTIGGAEPIAYLMHVVPPSPTAAIMQADPAERYTDVPEYDELGAIHFCTEEGYSLGAIAVADWMAQPDLVVAQPRMTGSEPPGLHQHSRMVWALAASGIAAGAANLSVPIRRGVAHPPMHASATPAAKKKASNANLDPAPRVRLIRPGPHLLPYTGTGKRRASAMRRRTGNRLSMGPASPLQPYLQHLAPYLISLAGIGLANNSNPNWLIIVCVFFGLTAVFEPWVWWAYHRLSDRDWRKMKAVYHPGASDYASRRFANTAELRFDGKDIGVVGAEGHQAWVAGPSDEDLGVTKLLRLQHENRTWAFAFADRLGHWRLVLPADSWAPGNDLTSLAAFAQQAGLQLDNVDVNPSGVGQNLFAGQGTARVRRSRGPYSRGPLFLSWFAGAATLLAMTSGFGFYTWIMVATLAGTLLPVAIRRFVTTWMDKPARRTAQPGSG